MAEWLGKLMQGWSTGAIIVGCAGITVVAAVVLFTAQGYDLLGPIIEKFRRNHGKKR